MIGHGSYGTVYLAEEIHSTEKKQFAVKTITKLALKK